MLKLAYSKDVNTGLCCQCKYLQGAPDALGTMPLADMYAMEKLSQPSRRATATVNYLG